MSKMVIVPIQKGNNYSFSEHDFKTYVLPAINKNVPKVVLLAALKRGKGTKRFEQSYNQVGSGKHGTNIH
ncbi:hypothetical protein [Priestia flexa]|uniref:hypothetical protein n=1 Tax=Priestia flexa TaxID=86664 RepID=UPI0004737A60|nr:hypothetical protein [Priestia flexa]